MRRVTLCLSLATVLLAPALPALAQPAFVNGLVIPGNTLDATGNTEANSGRFGFFSDISNGKRAEKWEGLAIGPKLSRGGRLILTGNDNDYSVTQNASTLAQFDVYVDFNGASVQRDLDQATRFNGEEVGPVPAGFVLLPGVLHAYRASASDLRGYKPPSDDRDHGHGHNGGRRER